MLHCGLVPDIRGMLQNVTQMSGTEFEKFVANVLQGLGYDTTIVGSRGDQGVDILLRKDYELIAVQFKDYS